MMFLSRFNILKICMSHLKTFHENGYEQINKIEVGIYFIFPFIPISVLFFSGILQKITHFSGLVEGFSIFTGFLFTFVVLLQQQYQVFDANNDTNRKELCRETFSNALFCILLAIITIAVVLLGTALNPTSTNSIMQGFSIIQRVFVLYMSILFFITLLMVVKRLYVLFDPVHNRSLK